MKKPDDENKAKNQTRLTYQNGNETTTTTTTSNVQEYKPLKN